MLIAFCLPTFRTEIDSDDSDEVMDEATDEATDEAPESAGGLILVRRQDQSSSV
jgi:hypothetical protein